MIETNFVTKKEDTGKRIDIYLSEKLEKSRSAIKNLIEKGKVFFDGKIINKSGEIIKEKDKEIKIFFEENRLLEATPQNIPINIVYQDNDLAVINKSQGMVTHPALGSPNNTLVNALLYYIKDLSGINGVLRPGIVHRLDKDTSGLLVIAKNDKAHNSLARQIAEKSANRYYIALVNDNIKEDSGKIDMPIARCKNDRKKMAIDSNGKTAITNFVVKERFNEYTLVEFKLETGRTHQIRVHAKFIKHPVVGDKIYGIKDKFGLNGQLLHSYKFDFEHPTTGKRMYFEAPLPDYFENVLAKLRNIYK